MKIEDSVSGILECEEFVNLEYPWKGKELPWPWTEVEFSPAEPCGNLRTSLRNLIKWRNVTFFHIWDFGVKFIAAFYFALRQIFENTTIKQMLSFTRETYSIVGDKSSIAILSYRVISKTEVSPKSCGMSWRQASKGEDFSGEATWDKSWRMQKNFISGKEAER